MDIRGMAEIYSSENLDYGDSSSPSSIEMDDPDAPLEIGGEETIWPDRREEGNGFLESGPAAVCRSKNLRNG